MKSEQMESAEFVLPGASAGNSFACAGRKVRARWGRMPRF